MTHKPAAKDALYGASEMNHPDIVAEQRRLNNEMRVAMDGIDTNTFVGIPDITAAVDARSKAVLAAEEFAASQCRVEMLRGQLKAEIERLQELGQQLKDLTTEAIAKELEPR